MWRCLREIEALCNMFVPFLYTESAMKLSRFLPILMLTAVLELKCFSLHNTVYTCVCLFTVLCIDADHT